MLYQAEILTAIKDGRDGHDAVESIASQPWCNGAVALAGNSYLAAAQWYVKRETDLLAYRTDKN